MDRDSLKAYFVDEAGDGTIFRQRSSVPIIGQDGCSKYFMLGLVYVRLRRLSQFVTGLMQQKLHIFSDPVLSSFPSIMRRGEENFFFHAKDDPLPVREMVFNHLQQNIGDVRFLAVVRDKQQVLAYIRGRNRRDPNYRYNPNELYDYLVRRLFTGRLHKADEYHVFFARRGNSIRTEALETALKITREQFLQKWEMECSTSIQVVPCYPYDQPITCCGHYSAITSARKIPICA